MYCTLDTISYGPSPVIRIVVFTAVGYIVSLPTAIGYIVSPLPKMKNWKNWRRVLERKFISFWAMMSSECLLSTAVYYFIFEAYILDVWYGVFIVFYFWRRIRARKAGGRRTRLLVLGDIVLSTQNTRQISWHVYYWRMIRGIVFDVWCWVSGYFVARKRVALLSACFSTDWVILCCKLWFSVSASDSYWEHKVAALGASPCLRTL